MNDLLRKKKYVQKQKYHSRNTTRLRKRIIFLERISSVNWNVFDSVVDPDPYGSAKLLPGSGSGITVPDPDPAKNERTDK